MARKFGTINVLRRSFDNYNYIINGEGDVGKTTLVVELGRKAANHEEGTFLITLGKENKPYHIDGAFGDPAPKFEKLDEIVNELVENNAEYPNTKFIAFDSLDELFRITEDYVVREWNRTCPPDKRAKSISAAYGGYYRGERRVMDLIGKLLERLESVNLHFIFIGHTKKKTKADQQTGIEYETITCNLDNNYYTFIKDKVNLVGTAYKERVITNIESKQNPFTKKNVEVGSLVSETRVMSFVADGFCIDTKSHFPFIAPKINLNATEFINAVESAIADEAKWRAEHPGETPALINPYAEAEEKAIAAADLAKEEESDNLDDFFDDEEPTIKEDTTVEPIKEDTDVAEVTAESDDIEDIFAEEDEAEGSEMSREDMLKIARQKASSDPVAKNKIKNIIAEQGKKLAELPDEILKEIVNL